MATKLSRGAGPAKENLREAVSESRPDTAAMATEPFLGSKPLQDRDGSGLRLRYALPRRRRMLEAGGFAAEFPDCLGVGDVDGFGSVKSLDKSLVAS